MGQNLRYLFGDDYPPKGKSASLFKRLLGCSPGHRGFDPQPYGMVNMGLAHR